MAMAEPPTFMTLPTELRLKIYEAIFTGVTIVYATKNNQPPTHFLERSAPGTHLSTRPIMVRKVTPQHPFTLLCACKTIKQEATEIARRSPISVELHDWYLLAGKQSPLVTQLPHQVHHRICEVMINEARSYSSLENILSSCSDPSAFTSLRHINIWGHSARLGITSEIARHVLGNGGNEYNFSHGQCVQTVQFRCRTLGTLTALVDFGIVSVKAHCGLLSVDGDYNNGLLVWNKNGMRAKSLMVSNTLD